MVCVYIYTYIYMYIYIYICDCYSVIKKNEMLPFTEAWMNLEGILLSEISQTERQTPCYLTCEI